METDAVLGRVRRIATARADAAGSVRPVDAAAIGEVLRDVAGVRSWLDACEAVLTSALRRQASCPEAVIAASSRGSTAAASRTVERAELLEVAPTLADSLDDGAITAGHVDAVTAAVASLEPGLRDELVERCERLVDVAEAATVEQWRRRVRDEARRMATDGGMSRLEQQRRATAVNTWVDRDGMWNLRGRFDPVTGVAVAARLDAAVETLFGEATPASCPSDPIARQRHLRALALARLVTDTTGLGDRRGRAEYVVVVDTTGDADRPASVTGADWEVDWPIPVEIPHRVLIDMMNDGDADIQPVIVRNGIILYAPGALDLGRTTRLANRAQRRALRGLYATCSIPGCTAHFDHCKLHHIIWWRHGGRTDLDNLIPVCTRHHTDIHHHGWTLHLGPDRQLTVTQPDGTVMTTGPPRRRTA